IKLESVRLVFEYLRDHADTDIASAHLVITGRDVVLCAGDELVDVMNSRGQGVLNLSLNIRAVKTDLDAHPDVTPGSSVQSIDSAPQRVAL
ncbi:MAG: putative MerR family transcriptional regulator, partial [Ilumatobacteraceae bacterium]|nr:putative MerR family transcriptional regulator [Ilumatobacteraceae bacterium]